LSGVLEGRTALQGGTAVITGASSGIGLAIAQSLALAGMNLVLGARSSEKLDLVARSLGAAATAVVTDVKSEADTRALMRTAVDLHGGIDVVVANAGVYIGGDFAGGDLRGFLDLIDTNVGGVIRTVHAALEHMLPVGTGDIVITSSVSGHQSIPWEPVYSASKHALQALTHTIRRQLAGTGVRIGAVAPGIVLNDLWKGASEEAALSAGVAEVAGLRSEDVADAVLYMLTRPRHVNIRDLVLLPTNQQI
jgi:ribitol 2-dehydrogenase